MSLAGDGRVDVKGCHLPVAPDMVSVVGINEMLRKQVHTPVVTGKTEVTI